MANQTWLDKALRPGTFHFAWVASSAVFIALTAALVILSVVLKGNDFRWSWIQGTQDLSVAPGASNYQTNKQAYERHLQRSRGDQCEQVDVEAVAIETQNTWSNMAYVFAGLFILFRCPRLSGRIFGVYVIFVGVTSGLYHASLYGSNNRLDFQTWDIAGLNAALLSMIIFALDLVLQRFSKRTYDLFQSTVGGTIVRIVLIILFPAVMGTIMAVFRQSVPIFESTMAFIICVGVLFFFVFFIVINTFSSVENHSKYADVVNDSQPSDYLNYNNYDPKDGGMRGPKPNPFMRIFVHSIWGSLLIILIVAGIGFTCRLMDGQGSNRVAQMFEAYPAILTSFPKVREDFKDLAELPVHAPKAFCNPEGFIQPHAIWHLFGALTLLLGYDLFARLFVAPKPRVFVYDRMETSR